MYPKTGVLLTLFVTLVQLNLAAQTYAYGNYTGHGVATSISGLGFSPEAIIIKSNGAYEAVFTTANMPAGKTKQLGTSSNGLITGEITSLNSDGFTIGTGNRTNHAGTQYNWIAFNESTNIHVGTYVGAGADLTVSGCGFQPEAFLLCGDDASGNSDAGFITAYWVTNGSEGFITSNTALTSTQNYINTWNADGWTVTNGGTEAAGSPSYNGIHYYYIAFNQDGTTIKQNFWTAGDGTTDWAVTDPGFKPDFVIAKQQTHTPVFRVASYPNATDRTLFFSATSAESGDIKSLDASGFTAEANSAYVNVAWQDHIYYAMSGGTSLPVQMTSFNAVKEENNVILSWETASEINSDHFEIMHSTDGVSFESIGSINAHGNTNHASEYSFVNENPADGIHYYQLVEYDVDGSSQTFRTLSVNISSKINTITQLFPNPTSNNISLYYNSTTGGTYKLTITDINGNALYFAHIPSMIGENKFKMTLEPYEEGIYFINLTDPTGTVSSVKVIKKN